PHRHVHRLRPPARPERPHVDLHLLEARHGEEVAAEARRALEAGMGGRGAERDRSDVAPARPPDLPLRRQVRDEMPVRASHSCIRGQVAHGGDLALPEGCALSVSRSVGRVTRRIPAVLLVATLAAVACGHDDKPQTAARRSKPTVTTRPSAAQQTTGPYAVGVRTFTFVDESRPLNVQDTRADAPRRT